MDLELDCVFNFVFMLEFLSDRLLIIANNEFYSKINIKNALLPNPLLTAMIMNMALASSFIKKRNENFPSRFIKAYVSANAASIGSRTKLSNFTRSRASRTLRRLYLAPARFLVEDSSPFRLRLHEFQELLRHHFLII